MRITGGWFGPPYVAHADPVQMMAAGKEFFKRLRALSLNEERTMSKEKKQAAKPKAYLADGSEVELLAFKAKIVHADGSEAEAWVTQEAPEQDTDNAS